MKATLTTLSTKVDALALNQSINHHSSVANEVCTLCSNFSHTAQNFHHYQPIKRLILSRYMPYNHIRKPPTILLSRSSDPILSQDSSPNDSEESDPPAYIPKAYFPQRLAKVKKWTSTGEIMEIFKQVSINILCSMLLSKFPLMPSFWRIYALKKRNLHVTKRHF